MNKKEIPKNHPIYTKENGWHLSGPFKTENEDYYSITAYKRGVGNKCLSYQRFYVECILGRMLERKEKIFKDSNGIMYIKIMKLKENIK